jgi:hypothetical protein
MNYFSEISLNLKYKFQIYFHFIITFDIKKNSKTMNHVMKVEVFLQNFEIVSAQIECSKQFKFYFNDYYMRLFSLKSH